jgi:hypothetical protein
VTAAKIQSNSVTAVKIAAGAITANKLAANAVTANSIAAGSISSGAIATGAINASYMISDGVIVGNKIAANTISSANIVAGTIGADRLAAGSITAGTVGTNEIVTYAANIKDAVITGAKIGYAAITTAKIEDAAVETLKIDGNAVTVPLVGSISNPTTISAGNSVSCWVGPISWSSSATKPTHVLIQASVQFDGSNLGGGATSRAVALEIYNNSAANFSGAALRGRVWGQQNENLPIGLTVTGCLNMSNIGLSQYFLMRASIPSSSHDGVSTYKKVTVNSITVMAAKR